MKIFVAGATGVLGRAAVPRLITAGHEVRGIARSPEKAEQLRTQGAEPVAVDVFDHGAMTAAVAGCETVIHMATHIPPLRRAWRVSAWATNDRLRREGTHVMVEAALATGATRFIKESVCFSYPDRGDQWIDEDTPLDDPAILDATRDAEQTALSFTGDGRAGVVLRFGLFYSADARATEEGLSVARRGMSPLLGPAEAYQPSIHVDDAASAIVAALSAPPGAYIVADEPITKGQWNSAFAEAFGIGRRLRPTPKIVLKASRNKVGALAKSWRVSSARFRAATGWEPHYPDARVGLKAVAAEWKAGTGD